MNRRFLLALLWCGPMVAAPAPPPSWNFLGEIDLASCGGDRVPDPERLAVRVRVSGPREMFARSTAVVKNHYFYEADICSGGEDEDRYYCETEVWFPGAKMSSRASTLGGMPRAQSDADLVLGVRRSIRVEENAECPRDLDLSGDHDFLYVEGRANLDVGRVGGRNLRVMPFSRHWARGRVTKEEGNRYRLTQWTVAADATDSKELHWEHDRIGRENEDYSSYCSGRADLR